MKKALVVAVSMCILCAASGAGMVCTNAYAQSYPIVISTDSYPVINIVIYAPDFNSNPYAIDTIGVDGSTVTIFTRDASIPYKLAETGPDTGYFAGYVILSSTTSTCSPVCGPTDGFIAAGGDDAITVSFTYADGHTVSASSYPKSQSHTIPEFPFASLGLLAGVGFLSCLRCCR